MQKSTSKMLEPSDNYIMEKDTFDFFTPLLTPLIAIIALWIARQQWIVQRYKAKFDLFERRMKIYEGIREVLVSVMRDGSLDKVDVSEFYTHVRHASFLFDNRIQIYINEIEMNVREIQKTWFFLYGNGSLPVSDKRTKYAEENNIAITALLKQLDDFDKKFSEYMKINKI